MVQVVPDCHQGEPLLQELLNAVCPEEEDPENVVGCRILSIAAPLLRLLGIRGGGFADALHHGQNLLQSSMPMDIREV